MVMDRVKHQLICIADHWDAGSNKAGIGVTDRSFQWECQFLNFCARSRMMPRSIPDRFDRVLEDMLVRRDDAQPMLDGLADQQAVKGILVDERKRFYMTYAGVV